MTQRARRSHFPWPLRHGAPLGSCAPSTQTPFLLHFAFFLQIFWLISHTLETALNLHWSLQHCFLRSWAVPTKSQASSHSTIPFPQVDLQGLLPDSDLLLDSDAPLEAEYDLLLVADGGRVVDSDVLLEGEGDAPIDFDQDVLLDSEMLLDLDKEMLLVFEGPRVVDSDVLLEDEGDAPIDFDQDVLLVSEMLLEFERARDEVAEGSLEADLVLEGSTEFERVELSDIGVEEEGEADAPTEGV